MGDGSPIRRKYASLLSPTSQNVLADYKVRKSSANSLLSNASDASEFLEHKIKTVELEMDIADFYKKSLTQAYQQDNIEEGELTEALDEVNQEHSGKKREWIALKRQKVLIEEDIEEGPYATLEKAYAAAMKHRVKIPTQLSKAEQNLKKHTQAKFKGELERYYAAARTNDGDKSVFCAVTKAWWDAKLIKAAHLVPKSLQSEELAYMFGADSMDLSDPRNGLLVHRNIEEALDRGTAVIVPVPAKGSSRSEWKLLLTEESLRNQVAAVTSIVASYPSPPYRWKDLDGTTLEFLNDNRPARRFLYFKYVMTYLMAKDLGNTKWVDRYPSQGTMWCTPGPYLRRSMLTSLARQVSDHFLPEALYKDNTFDHADGGPNKTPDQEKVLAMSLGLKLEDEKAKTKISLAEEDDEDDGEEGDNDDDNNDEEAHS
ncbi:hypothetical protein MMC07_003611 [Pseudocyphellaria aurata]|nr:hypothetical protein [Pseudocyphellaria aurata]